MTNYRAQYLRSNTLQQGLINTANLQTLYTMGGAQLQHPSGHGY